MNGAESLVKTAVDAGVELCFANPGTTEMPVVNAMDTVPGLRAVLGLQENAVTGAADGYGRMAGTPALTLLHLGPGFANGIANLHNARRANTPVVNLIGEHATWHQAADAPLASDIEALAGAVSGWVQRCHRADDLAAGLVEAVAAAQAEGGQVATLILPHDCQLAESSGPVAPNPRPPAATVDDARIDASVQALRTGQCLLFLGGKGMSEAGLKAAERIRKASGCAVMYGRPTARVERGGGLPAPRQLPYLPELAIEALTPFRSIVFAGAGDPVAFFGWPGYPSYLVPEGRAKVWLARPEEDALVALEALAEALHAPDYAAPNPVAPPAVPEGPLTAESLSQAIAALQPEDTILVEEAITSGWSYQAQSKTSPRYTQLFITGGAIGLGPSMAVGAAIACPSRKVINFEADGSGLYAVQALWTQAREGLDIVTVIASNRSYRILQMELQRAGLNQPGPCARVLTDLTEPTIDWPSLARGFGVPGTRADTVEAFVTQLRGALAEPGPSLIEAVIG